VLRPLNRRCSRPSRAVLRSAARSLAANIGTPVRHGGSPCRQLSADPSDGEKESSRRPEPALASLKQRSIACTSCIEYWEVWGYTVRPGALPNLVGFGKEAT
jgi:hypothetical protein